MSITDRRPYKHQCRASSRPQCRDHEDFNRISSIIFHEDLRKIMQRPLAAFIKIPTRSCHKRRWPESSCQDKKNVTKSFWKRPGADLTRSWYKTFLRTLQKLSWKHLYDIVFARSSRKDLLERISSKGLRQDFRKIFWQGLARDHAEHPQDLNAKSWREDWNKIFAEWPVQVMHGYRKVLFFPILLHGCDVFRRISLIFFEGPIPGRISPEFPQNFRIRNCARSCKDLLRANMHTWNAYGHVIRNEKYIGRNT